MGREQIARANAKAAANREKNLAQGRNAARINREAAARTRNERIAGATRAAAQKNLTANHQRNLTFAHNVLEKRAGNVRVTNVWVGSTDPNTRYSAFYNYNQQWHDRTWWRNHYSNIVFVLGGWWYWGAGYWFPAWGYDPYAWYWYDGPIYTGYANLTPDRVVVEVQQDLAADGYYAGPIDGRMGPQTRAGAIGGRQGEDGPVRRLQMMQTEISGLLADQGSLQVLPDLTGGRAVLNTNAPQEKVPEIFRESDAYYTIGFEPGTSGEPGSRRSIEVKVARAGVQVFAQRQYRVRAVEKAASVVSIGAAAQMSLDKALRGLLPNASRPLTMSVSAFADADKANAMVMVNVDVGAFADASETAMPLEFAVSAVDPTGRQIAFARETATVTFKAGTSNRRAEREGMLEALMQLTKS